MLTYLNLFPWLWCCLSGTLNYFGIHGFIAILGGSHEKWADQNDFFKESLINISTYYKRNGKPNINPNTFTKDCIVDIDLSCLELSQLSLRSQKWIMKYGLVRTTTLENRRWIFQHITNGMSDPILILSPSRRILL